MKKLNIGTERYNKLTPSKNYFLSLCSSIIYQQISTKAGDSIYNKFLKLFKNRKPTPKLFLLISETEIRSAGVSPQKFSYLKGLSEKFLKEIIDEKKIIDMNDDEIINHLIQIKGVGKWTAEMFLIFGLNRKNVISYNDLGIRKGFVKVFNLRKIPSEYQMKRLSKPFDGELTKFGIYLWSQLDKK